MTTDKGLFSINSFDAEALKKLPDALKTVVELPVPSSGITSLKEQKDRIETYFA